VGENFRPQTLISYFEYRSLLQFDAKQEESTWIVTALFRKPFIEKQVGSVQEARDRW